MNPKLSDDTVAGLPLSLGRAELLEEIMSTPVLDDRPVAVPSGRHRGWLAPVVAAAVVALLVAGSAWWATTLRTDQQAAIASAPPGAFYALLDADGWTASAAYEYDADAGEVQYTNGTRSLQVDWYPASLYADRTEGGTPDDEVRVLGAPAVLWTYSDDDHKAFSQPVNDHFLEIRGSGLPKADFLTLLDRVRVVTPAEFDAALPDGFVRNAEREHEIARMLDQIADHAHPLLPEGVRRSSITSDQSDPYQLGAEVTGQVTCAWLRQYADARASGDDALAQRAADVLATARDWPVLHRMDGRGDWPESIWELADLAASDDLPADYVDRFGCAG